MCEIWNAKRIKIEEKVVKTVLELFEHTGSGALLLPVSGTTPKLYIVAGDREAIQTLLKTDESCY